MAIRPGPPIDLRRLWPIYDLLLKRILDNSYIANDKELVELIKTIFTRTVLSTRLDRCRCLYAVYCSKLKEPPLGGETLFTYSAKSTRIIDCFSKNIFIFLV